MPKVCTYESIRTHLSPYKAYAKRRTTINHAFASALAAVDDFEPEVVKASMLVLGQDPTALVCVYCGNPASTWDHLHALVRNEKYAGRGHRVGNLVPCCKPCNSAKGSKPWRAYADAKGVSENAVERIAAYEELLDEVCDQDELADLYPDLMGAYNELRVTVSNLLRVADGIAAEIQRLEGLRRRASRASG